MNKVRTGYKRLARIRTGVWLYRCTRCGQEIRSTGTGSHELHRHPVTKSTP